MFTVWHLDTKWRYSDNAWRGKHIEPVAWVRKSKMMVFSFTLVQAAKTGRGRVTANEVGFIIIQRFYTALKDVLCYLLMTEFTKSSSSYILYYTLPGISSVISTLLTFLSSSSIFNVIVHIWGLLLLLTIIVYLRMFRISRHLKWKGNLD